MKAKLKIVNIQTSLFWESALKNRAYFDKLLNSLNKEIDIVLLPEMFTSGFTMNAKKVFETMDKDHNGHIDREELAAGLTKMGVKNVDQEVEKIFMMADNDGSGTIEFTEWVTATIDKKLLLTSFLGFSIKKSHIN